MNNLGGNSIGDGITANNRPTARHFALVFVFSLLIAFSAWLAPQQMPIDFQAMFRWSFPLAGIWLVTLVISVFRFRWKSSLLLIGAAPALYWPIHYVLYGLPPCYYVGNCI